MDGVSLGASHTGRIEISKIYRVVQTKSANSVGFRSDLSNEIENFGVAGLWSRSLRTSLGQGDYGI